MNFMFKVIDSERQKKNMMMKNVGDEGQKF